MHLSMLSPTSPPPGHRWGFVQLVIQRTYPRGNHFLTMSLSRCTQYPGTMWRFVNILCYLNSSTITKSPLVGSIFLTEDAQILTYAQEWGMGLDIYRCITCTSTLTINQSIHSNRTVISIIHDCYIREYYKPGFLSLTQKPT